MNESLTLKRDCQAVLIPAGTTVTLPAGTEVHITQSLGGTYTVIAQGCMARIAGQDADALGLASDAAAARTETTHPAGPVDEKLVWDQMRTCYDPEIPVNIVDLGLIYDCQIVPLPEGGSAVNVKMTLTAPGCGMGAYIAGDVENKICNVPGVKEVHVELVWDPIWNQGMMTEAAKLQLGLL